MFNQVGDIIVIQRCLLYVKLYSHQSMKILLSLSLSLKKVLLAKMASQVHSETQIKMKIELSTEIFTAVKQFSAR